VERDEPRWRWDDYLDFGAAMVAVTVLFFVCRFVSFIFGPWMRRRE